MVGRNQVLPSQSVGCGLPYSILKMNQPQKAYTSSMPYTYTSIDIGTLHITRIYVRQKNAKYYVQRNEEKQQNWIKNQASERKREKE